MTRLELQVVTIVELLNANEQLRAGDAGATRTKAQRRAVDLHTPNADITLR